MKVLIDMTPYNDKSLMKNSKYQAAWKFNQPWLSDEDPNNIFWLNKDIKNLQDLLGNFTFVSSHPIIPAYHFYENGTEMNPLFMESAGTTRSKYMKKLEAESCSFPVIAIFVTINDKSDN
ncbi:8297_t:CDS:2, partial [Gigaspora margarita]